jgi:hypothetical protein
MHFSSDAREIVRTRQHVYHLAQYEPQFGIEVAPLYGVRNQGGAASVLAHFPAQSV